MWFPRSRNRKRNQHQNGPAKTKMEGRTMPTLTASAPPPATDKASLKAIENLANQHDAVQAQLAKAIVGQRTVIENVLLTIFCGGHALIVGVPGLAKTLLVQSLGKTLALSFKRIQFTPDLMPSDI